MLDSCDQSRNNKAGGKNTYVKRKFFDHVLTREHCEIEKNYKVVCRNKELLMSGGRSAKSILFISSDANDFCLNS